jgi:DNA polymerase III alpha subunit (gram-positive type)
MNTFYIDFETTGLNPYHDEIIEFAIKKNNSEFKIENLVKPTRTILIPEKITEITGITSDMIFNNVNVISNMKAVENMFTFLGEHYDGNGYIYLVAHNGIRFDFVFFKELVNNYLLHKNSELKDIKIFDIYPKIRYIDSLDVARKMVPHLYSYSQKNLCKIFNIVQNNAHRAIGDVEDLEKIYITIVNYGINKFKLDNDFIGNTDRVYDYINNI